MPARRVRIVRPANRPASDQLMCVVAHGDSLVGDGIRDGDRLLLKTNFSPEELTAGCLAAVRLPTGSIAVKHFYLEDRPAGLLAVLMASNTDYDDLEYGYDEVEVVGVVVGRAQMAEEEDAPAPAPRARSKGRGASKKLVDINRWRRSHPRPLK
jgi:SOS-response transcriptional repressor LexA